MKLSRLIQVRNATFSSVSMIKEILIAHLGFESYFLCRGMRAILSVNILMHAVTCSSEPVYISFTKSNCLKIFSQNGIVTTSAILLYDKETR